MLGKDKRKKDTADTQLIRKKNYTDMNKAIEDRIVWSTARIEEEES